MAKRRFKNFSGLYGDLNTDISPFYVHSELIQDRSESFKWQIEPHVHSHLYQFFFVESGEVSIETVAEKLTASSRSIICISPGSIHGFVFSPGIKGRIISIADAVIEDLLIRAPHMLLILTGKITVQKVKSAEIFKDLIDLAFHIQKEHENAEPERELAVRSLLQLMLVKLYRLLKTSEQTPGSISRNEQYFIGFQSSIRSSATFSKSVKDYAAELNITSIHLNRICQSVAGKTASWLIQEHAVREAQKLLRYTTHSISEIAYQLNFTAPGYFARLFRKHTGKTPEDYRKLK